jgi:phosphoglucomutase
VLHDREFAVPELLYGFWFPSKSSSWISRARTPTSKFGDEPITAKLTNAPGNQAPIGGLKIIATSAWFAARPSGTESLYKIYAESFKDRDHLNAIVSEAQTIVNNTLECRRCAANRRRNGRVRSRRAGP